MTIIQVVREWSRGFESWQQAEFFRNYEAPTLSADEMDERYALVILPLRCTEFFPCVAADRGDVS